MVLERRAGPDRFVAETGPFERYERSVTVDRHGRSVETVEYRLAVPFWWVLFALPVRRALRRTTRRDRPPWWAPPQVIDARASAVIGLLCAIALVQGYVGTMLTQTITYAAAEFAGTRRDQGQILAMVRAGVLIGFVLAACADRVGRRRLVTFSATAACVAAAAGSMAPSLPALGATQLVATGAAGALAMLIGIVSAEEVPSGARAYSLSLITMAAALGAGMCVWVLPVADLASRGWRLVYLVPLLGILVVRSVGRRLPETRRFERPHAEATLSGHGGRLALLAAAGFLGAMFVAPAFQFQNDFLRVGHGFSAARISLFTILTSTPGAVGILAGGRLADVHGRRRVGAAGIVFGTIATVTMFAVSGWQLWAVAAVGSVVGALIVPALGVYRPELFPTALRGRASGLIEVVTLTGSAIGLVVVGSLIDRWGSYGRPMALVALGPVALAVLVLARFPETARRELEDLNPEDRARKTSHSASLTSPD